MRVIRIDLRTVVDEGSFHNLFSKAFGFPEFYGRNMNAWIDCMSSLDAPDDGMSSVHVEPGGTMVLQLEGVMEFKDRCPDVYDALVECTAFVNRRRIDSGEGPLLALAFD